MQCGSNSARALVGARSSHRSCRSDRSSISRRLAVDVRPLTDISVARRWCQLVATTRKRQRARRSEGLGLGGVGWMRLNALHDCRVFTDADDSGLLKPSTTVAGEKQANVSPTKIAAQADGLALKMRVAVRSDTRSKTTNKGRWSGKSSQVSHSSRRL